MPPRVAFFLMLVFNGYGVGEGERSAHVCDKVVSVIAIDITVMVRTRRETGIETSQESGTDMYLRTRDASAMYYFLSQETGVLGNPDIIVVDW